MNDTRTDSNGDAFESSTAHLLAECERAAVLLEGYRTRLEQDGPRPATISVSDPPPDPHRLSLAVSPEASARAIAREETIRKRVEATRKPETLRLAHVVEAFDLSPRHRDVLVLALLPTVNPQYQEVFAELQNDLSATQPTVGFLASLFSETDAEFLTASRLVGPESPLRAYNLIEIGEPDESRIHRTSRPVFVEDRLESYLFGDDGLDPALEPVLEMEPATGRLDDLRIDPSLAETLAALADGDEPRRMYWYGPHGTEKRSAVEAVTLATEVLRGDLRTIAKAGLLAQVVREATLHDRPVHLESVSTATADRALELSVADVLDAFESFRRDLVLTGTNEWTPAGLQTASVDAIVEFPRPSFELRRQFWAERAETLPDGIDPTVLAGIFELTQGQLEAAIATARSLAGPHALTAADIYEGCSAQSAHQLSELAEELDPTANWVDIALPPGTMRGLQTLAAHITHKGRIYAEWGFDTRFTRGTGVVGLFTGPSGTGKTMAAEIIANDVGMRLYKIDLSSVVSKYIGETEENLERIFTEAEHSNAILLFDEADAVFGDRAGVSDATDRYANVEVNYLLQRIESYNGVVLLTTNYESNIDTAFMRRIDHSISFKRPDEATRHIIWESIFPDETPVADLDYEFLSTFELTGGDIRTTAQTAAILAAADEESVEMKHVVRGLQRELAKSGKMVDPRAFEPYREYLELD